MAPPPLYHLHNILTEVTIPNFAALEAMLTPLLQVSRSMVLLRQCRWKKMICRL